MSSFQRLKVSGPFPIWIFPFNIRSTIYEMRVTINQYPLPKIKYTTHSLGSGIRSRHCEVVAKDTILQLGNGTNSVVQRVGDPSLGSQNSWKQHGRSTVASIGGKGGKHFEYSGRRC